MNETNNVVSNSTDGTTTNKNSTMSGIFAFVGSISSMIALVFYLHWWEQYIWFYTGIINRNISSELEFASNVEGFFLFIALASNIVSLVLASLEFNKKIISRDRLFVHISLVIFTFLFFVRYYI